MTTKYPAPPDVASVYEYLDGKTSLRDIDGYQNVRCVLHDDSSPSACLNMGENRYKCFVCGVWGSSWNLLMLGLDLEFWEAVRFAGINDLIAASAARTGRSDSLLRRSNAATTTGLSRSAGHRPAGSKWSPSWLGR